MAAVAVSVALAGVVGAVVAVSGSLKASVSNAALNCASPAAYVVPAGKHHHGNGTGTAAPATAATSTATPTTSVTSTATPTVAAASSTAAATVGAATTAPNTTAATTTATASAAPCTSAAAAAAPAVNPEAGPADLALTNPVDPAGNAISLTQSAAQAATSLNCTLTVPADPLSAQGLATPWQLGDGCSEANPNEEAFVESTILAPNGQLQVYDPLVITQGSTPAVTPTAPTIPQGAQVIINVGFNGNNLVLQGDGAAQGNCIDAFGNSIIAQTSACNAAAFYAAANSQIAQGTLTVPPLGTDTNGHACESTESFSIIDQDQSDNVISEYLLNGNGQTAQNSAANKNAMDGATVITNGSDDALLSHFVDAALGCTPFTATDTTSPNGTDGSQALNVLSARQGQQGTIALLPVNDPQLLVAGQFSVGKTNTFRTLNDQTPLQPLALDVINNRIIALQGQLVALNDRNMTFQNQITIIQGRGESAAAQAADIAAVNTQIASVNSQIASVNSQIAALQAQANGGGSLTAFTMQNAAAYCQNMVNIQPAKLQGDMTKELNFNSPVPAVGNTLATFMGARLSASFTNLNCQNFGLTNPVTVTVDGNGVATAVAYNTAPQTASIPGVTPAATATGATATAATASATATATPASNQGSAYNKSVPRGRKGHKENGAGM